jgi:anti-anti-sigma regulatory factor
MASNFRVFTMRNCDTLHLKLMGDFDGTSAFQVLDVLKRNSSGAQRVIIHTNRLAHIHPFGIRAFQHSLSAIDRRSLQLFFTGDNAAAIAPLNSIYL